MHSLWLLAVLLAGGAQAQAPVDPTRPSGVSLPAASGAPASGQALHLTLVRLGAQPLAVINGHSLRPGDHLGEYTLRAVRPGSVLLTGPAGQIVLRLSADTPIKKTKKTP